MSEISTYLAADQHRDDRSTLTEICMKDELCVGVTTNGLMQRSLLPFNEWQKVTAGGMLVYGE